METKISKHAEERMSKYGLNRQQVLDCVANPSTVVSGKFGRKIAQKRLNGYVLRVIYNEMKNFNKVITVYKAKRERYEI